MDSNTFPDSRVREAIQKSFVPVRIDTTEDQETPGKYGINAIPTMFVLDESGAVIDRAVGFVPPDSLIQFLEKSLTKG